MRSQSRHAIVASLLVAALLAAPSVGWGAPTGYMRCYQARRTKGTAKLPQASVTLDDQFVVPASSLVRGPRELCNPASVDGSTIPGVDPEAHLTCYSTSKNPKVHRLTVEVTNAFGVQQLALSKPFQLCEPSEKQILTPPEPAPPPSSLAIDHYRCYKANFRDGFVFTPPPGGVTVGDQFEIVPENSAVRVENRLTFCTPVSKDGSPILDPATHLTCFRLLDDELDPNLDVEIENALSIPPQYLTVRRTTASSRVCLPSTLTVIASPSGAFLDEVLP